MNEVAIGGGAMVWTDCSIGNVSVFSFDRFSTSFLNLLRVLVSVLSTLFRADCLGFGLLGSAVGCSTRAQVCHCGV